MFFPTTGLKTKRTQTTSLALKLSMSAWPKDLTSQKNHISVLIQMQRHCLLRMSLRQFQGLTFTKLPVNLKASRTSRFQSQSRKTILLDTVGSNLLTKKASWRRIWPWVVSSSRMSSLTSRSLFQKWKKLKFLKNTHNPESVQMLLPYKTWLKSSIKIVELLKIQSMMQLLNQIRKSLIPTCFTWEESIPLITGLRHNSKMKEWCLGNLDQFSWELMSITRKSKVFKQSSKRLMKSMKPKLPNKLPIMTFLDFYVLKLKNTSEKHKKSAKMSPKKSGNVPYVTKNSRQSSFWPSTSLSSILRSRTE